MCIFAALPGLGALFGGGAAAAAGAGSGIGTALQALGTVASAFGTFAGGVAQKRVGDYNAKVAENNAVAEQQRSAYEAGMIRDDKRRILGTQLATQAGNGLSVQSGTPVAVLGDTAGSAEMDILARLYGGESAATAFRNDATLQRAQGKAAMGASVLGAGTTLLTGFGRMAANRAYNPLRIG